MILIIMRHGEAVEYKEPDHTRVLTEYGVQQSEDVGKWLQAQLPILTLDQHSQVSDIDLAIVSPYLRTQQTFRGVSKHINVGRQVTVDTVTPLGNAVQSADLIHGFASDSNAPKCMLIVTHMPLVSLLADKVCLGFNTGYFETADTLLIDYSVELGTGKQLALFEGNKDGS
jgi:phosphohistidine phosphatase